MARWLLIFQLLALIQLGVSQRQPVSVDDFSEIQYFGQVSAATYCTTNNNGPNIKVKCKSGNCPLVEATDTWSVIGLSNAPVTDVTGFVACDYSHNTTIIAFRGSESRLNWKMNFEVLLVDIDLCKGCKAATGFWKSWTESRDPILAAINASQKFFPENRIVVTGHSLGGAIATLAAGALRKSGLKVDLYTYGSPRVGNKELSEWLTNQTSSKGNNYRVTHLNDPVPQLPPTWFGYRHIAPEYYIAQNNSINVTIANITKLPGFENPLGNYQWNRMNIYAHTWYFNVISACYDGPPLDWGWYPKKDNTTKNGAEGENDKETDPNDSDSNLPKGSTPDPDKTWIDGVLSQLAGFIPTPPKGITPLLVPGGSAPSTGANSAQGLIPPGMIPPGMLPPDRTRPKPKLKPPPRPTGLGTDSQGGDLSQQADPQEGDSQDAETDDSQKAMYASRFQDLSRAEMERNYGFDRVREDRAGEGLEKEERRRQAINDKGAV